MTNNETPQIVQEICTAYEAGFGDGLAGRNKPNPYTQFSNAWHAFAMGRYEGAKKLAAEPVPDCPKCGVAHYPNCEQQNATIESLRRDLADPPPDVQEAVLRKLNLWPPPAPFEPSVSQAVVEQQIAEDVHFFGTAFYRLVDGRKVRIPPNEIYIEMPKGAAPTAVVHKPGCAILTAAGNPQCSCGAVNRESPR